MLLATACVALAAAPATKTPAPLATTLLNADRKMPILQLAAALDRGQSHNPTSSDAYRQRADLMRSWIAELSEVSPPLPTQLADLDGEWELIYATVPHGIFRSSPFFLAIQEAYARAGAPDKAELFFRLHELQTCSWGVSKIGRVAQTIDSEASMLYSEFDTNLLSLTVIPILGWFKLLPTFGGCVVTASSVKLEEGGKLAMEVQYTTSRKVDGLSGLRPLPGEWGLRIADAIWNLKVPVGPVWKLLPWNGGKAPTCVAQLTYFDGDWRIVRDGADEYFVYTRAVAPRPLER